MHSLGIDCNLEYGFFRVLLILSLKQNDARSLIIINDSKCSLSNLIIAQKPESASFSIRLLCWNSKYKGLQRKSVKKSDKKMCFSDANE